MPHPQRADELEAEGVKTWSVTEPYLDTKCKLGEGPYYSEARHELRFLDINSNKLHLVDINKGPDSLRSINTGIPIGVTADIEGIDGGSVILAGAKDGVTKFDLATGKHEYIVKYWSGEEASTRNEKMRANDGAVDTEGRFWVEAFEDPEIVGDPGEVGVLFRLDPGGKLKTMVEKMTIPNGITWNAMNDTMFLTDSPVKNVYAYDYDPTTGDISNKRTFFHLDEDCHPDGHAMDVEGNIWHACYGGWQVIRISTEGKITGKVLLPTRNITCPTFAGTELFITSAVEDEPDKYPDSAKFAGSVFRVDVGIRGMPKYKAKLPQSNSK